jgi:hypothetical protein
MKLSISIINRHAKHRPGEPQPYVQPRSSSRRGCSSRGPSFQQAATYIKTTQQQAERKSEDLQKLAAEAQQHNEQRKQR